jgi:predicted transcriptional regulator
MGKSVYSIVLIDEVVAKVDKLAYKNGTSRSNIINKILAEYVSFTTPEDQMREIFSQLGKKRFPKTKTSEEYRRR